MRKRKVIFIEKEEYIAKVQEGYIVVDRPLGSKLFRVCIPEQLRDHEELLSLVKLWSKGIFRNGMWYIRSSDDDIVNGFGETLWFMDLFDVIITYPHDEYFNISPQQMQTN